MFSKKVDAEIEYSDAIVQYEVAVGFLADIKQRQRVIIGVWVD